MTRCPHCKNAHFVMADADVSGTKARYRSVLCVECHTPLAFVEVGGLGPKIDELEKKLDATSQNLNALAVTINQMANRLR